MKKHKGFIIIGAAWIFIVACYLIFYTPKPDVDILANEMQEEVFTNLKSSNLESYLEDVDYEVGEKTTKENYDYPIDLVITFKDSFNPLPESSKYRLISELYDDHFNDPYDSDRNGIIYCGQSTDCHIRNLIIKTSSDEYVFKEKDDSLVTNGESTFSADDYSKVEKPATRSAAKVVGAFDKEKIYLYMKAAFDRLTNYGENYNPEVHDPLVAKMAAEKFFITESQALYIYTSYDVIE